MQDDHEEQDVSHSDLQVLTCHHVLHDPEETGQDITKPAGSTRIE